MTATLRRQAVRWTERRVGWHPYLGPGVSLPLSVLLDKCLAGGYRELYLIAGWDAAHTPPHEYFKGPTEQGWIVQYRPADTTSRRRGDYERDGKRVTVRMSAAWFGDYDGPAGMAFAGLTEAMHRYFGFYAHPMGTPARTGHALLESTLPDGREYLPTPAEEQDIIRGHFGQGHRECVALPEVESVNNVLVYDGRWMYASCLRHLPVVLPHYPVVHDERPDYAGPYQPGFYSIRFRVPAGWPYPGILSYRPPEGGRPFWPRSGRDAWQTWCTEPELRLAMGPFPDSCPDCKRLSCTAHGWKIHIDERILYAPQTAPGSDPAREWIEGAHGDGGLKGMYFYAEHKLRSKPVVTAVKNILRHTVGSWSATGRTDWHILPPGAENHLPPDVRRVNPVWDYDRRGRVRLDAEDQPVLLRTEYSRVVALDPENDPHMRPECAAYVWGRARARLHRFMLGFEPHELLWLLDDAVAVTADVQTHHLREDTGMIGDFRIKPGDQRQFAQSMPTPRTPPEYEALMATREGATNGA